MNKERIESMLRELETTHPVKGFRPGDIQVGYVPGPMGNVWMANKVIILPTWSFNDAEDEYLIIHEYCHFLREINDHRPEWHAILPFANWRSHDKKFKALEDQILTEHHMGIKRKGGMYAKYIYRNGKQESFFLKMPLKAWVLNIVSWLIWPLIVILCFVEIPMFVLTIAFLSIFTYLASMEYGLLLWSFFRARRIVVAQGRRWMWRGVT
jgi:hypothetical protein